MCSCPIPKFFNTTVHCTGTVQYSYIGAVQYSYILYSILGHYSLCTRDCVLNQLESNILFGRTVLCRSRSSNYVKAKDNPPGKNITIASCTVYTVYCIFYFILPYILYVIQSGCFSHSLAFFS